MSLIETSKRKCCKILMLLADLEFAFWQERARGGFVMEVEGSHSQGVFTANVYISGGYVITLTTPGGDATVRIAEEYPEPSTWTVAEKSIETINVQVPDDKIIIEELANKARSFHTK